MIQNRSCNLREIIGMVGFHTSAEFFKQLLLRLDNQQDFRIAFDLTLPLVSARNRNRLPTGRKMRLQQYIHDFPGLSLVLAGNFDPQHIRTGWRLPAEP